MPKGKYSLRPPRFTLFGSLANHRRVAGQVAQRLLGGNHALDTRVGFIPLKFDESGGLQLIDATANGVGMSKALVGEQDIDGTRLTLPPRMNDLCQQRLGRGHPQELGRRQVIQTAEQPAKS